MFDAVVDIYSRASKATSSSEPIVIDNLADKQDEVSEYLHFHSKNLLFSVFALIF